MHYYTQILSIILICFLSPLFPPTHVPLSVDISVHFLSFPLQSLLCTKEKEEKKGFAERLKLYFVYLRAVCLLSRYAAILSQRDRINLCGENPELLELGKAIRPLSQR